MREPRHGFLKKLGHCNALMQSSSASIGTSLSAELCVVNVTHKMQLSPVVTTIARTVSMQPLRLHKKRTGELPLLKRQYSTHNENI